MATKLLILVFTTYLVVHICFHVLTIEAQIYDSWSSASAEAVSVYSGGGNGQFDIDEFESLEEVGSNDEVLRRSLNYWKKTYYISYGAMSRNRVPCPPRSGRSYYTHDCFNARGPAHPYTRGCSCITRCRR